MNESSTSLGRSVGRREVLKCGGLLVWAPGPVGRATGNARDKPVWRESSPWNPVPSFATSHAIEDERFDTRRFRFDERNGARLVCDVRETRGPVTALDERVGWRVVDAGVDRASGAAEAEQTTLFLPATVSPDPGDDGALYRIEAVDAPVRGTFRRWNENHTTERFYPVFLSTTA